MSERLKQILKQKNEFELAAQFASDQMVDDVVTEMILDDVIAYAINNNKFSEIYDQEQRIHNLASNFLDQILSKVLNVMLRAEVVKPCLEIDTINKNLPEQVKQIIAARKYNESLIFASRPHDQFKVEDLRCIEDFVKEIVKESLQDSVCQSLADKLFWLPEKSGVLRNETADVCKKVMTKEFKNQGEVVFDAYLESMLHKLLLDFIQ